MMREQPLVTAFAPRFFFVVIDTREIANIHKAIACKYTSNNICTVVGEWHQGYFCLGYYFSSTQFDIVTRMAQKVWRHCGLVFGHDRYSHAGTALVSVRTLAFVFLLVVAWNPKIHVCWPFPGYFSRGATVVSKGHRSRAFCGREGTLHIHYLHQVFPTFFQRLVPFFFAHGPTRRRQRIGLDCLCSSA